MGRNNILVPQALIPDRFIAPRQTVRELENSQRCLYPSSESFSWVDLFDLSNKKMLAYQKFVSIPNLFLIINGLFEELSETARESTCDRAHIGCVVTDMNLDILSRGYNQKPKYASGPCDIIGCEPEVTCRLTTHAESVAFARLHPEDQCKELILFCNAAPCLDCMKLCEANNVKYVVYREARPQPQIDRPVMSLKTIKSDILFINYKEDDDATGN